jgi:hypothetical protein
MKSVVDVKFVAMLGDLGKATYLQILQPSVNLSAHYEAVSCSAIALVLRYLVTEALCIGYSIVHTTMIL